MRFAKIITIGLFLGLIVLVLTIYQSKQDFKPAQNIQAQTTQKHSRADDPTYAEELLGVNKLLTQERTERKALQDQIDALSSRLEETGVSGTESLKKNIADLESKIKKQSDEFQQAIKNGAAELGKTKDEITNKITAQMPSIDDLIAGRNKITQEVIPNLTSNNSPKKVDVEVNTTAETMGDQTSQGQMTADGNVSIKPFGSEPDPNIIPGVNGTGTGIINGVSNFLGNSNPLNLVPNDGPFQANIAGREKAEPIPIYTIPDTSTLVVNTMMTPLIGRVPGTKGEVSDPFRFKFITGAENLATNGHRIPGIDNIVWTGFAVGVRDQSCVRAYVDTVTYTFSDGRINTVTSGKGSGTGAANVLGYLTDPWGKPCIQGRYFSNASQYLKGRGLAAFTSAIAEGIAQADVTSIAGENGNIAQNITGNTSRYIAATGLAGTAHELADYIKERQAGAYDVIYVPSGMQIQLFVEQQINIDYNPNGRKISYDYSGNSPDQKQDLD